jgi:hypothetical protein
MLRGALAVLDRRLDRSVEGCRAVLVDEFEDPPFAYARGGDSGPHVAVEELREPIVRPEDLEHIPQRFSARD